jgi:predicted protein tyrosine phosphatase
MIRITSLPEFMPLKHGPEFRDFLRIKFDDTTEKTFNTLPADEQQRITLFDETMARDVVAFYDAWCDKCDIIVVHCDAGVSRSSAVAIALAEYGNHSNELERMVDHDKYWPNPWVWSTIRRITGWDSVRQRDFEELFQFVEGVHAHMGG